jgi:tRNA (guanosine-2'-O-)-methyltransferase
MREIIERRQLDLAVVIEDLVDPHNTAAIYRSAEAFGVAQVHLVYERAQWPGLNSAVTAHTHRWVSTERWYDPEICAKSLRKRGMTVYAAALTEEAVDYRDIDWTGPSAVVLGQERRGISEPMLEHSSGQVVVPMGGFAQSLNVSVCAGVILSEALRQRRVAGLCAPRWDEERERLFRQWVSREEDLDAAPPAEGE